MKLILCHLNAMNLFCPLTLPAWRSLGEGWSSRSFAIFRINITAYSREYRRTHSNAVKLFFGEKNFLSLFDTIFSFLSKITQSERGRSYTIPNKFYFTHYSIALYLLLITAPSFAYVSNRQVVTFISPHSISIDAARELAGWENLINSYTSDKTYSTLAITPEATLTFRPERIAQCLFGDAVTKCNCTFDVSGSQQSERRATAWLADYFGLPTDYKSLVTVQPSVFQGLIDFDLFVGWDRYASGLYFRIHAPLVYSRWNLNMCETLVTTGSDSYVPGYFNPEGINRAQLVENFTNFINGTDSPRAPNLIFNKLTYAKMSCSSVDLFKLSDIQIAFGYNILYGADYHLGGNIRFSVPTGNSPCAEFLFEPIIGNGHHWELGGGFSAHTVLWEDDETEEKAAVYLDCNITHLFSARQKRSFDILSSGPNSRYMLAEKMGKPIINNLRAVVNGQNIEPSYQYQKEVTTLANITTIPVDVSISVQADLALMIAYTQQRNSWTFGYSFWARSCDCITLCGPTPLDTETWAIKGDAQLFGFENTVSQTAVALSATQSNATINNGKNLPASGPSNAQEVAVAITNPGIDNPHPSISDSTNSGIFVALMAAPGGAAQINTSMQPIILTSEDINIDSARTGGRSQKIFASFTHIVPRREFDPYLGFGAEIEFGQSSSCKQITLVKEKSCINTALSFWGVWFKTGVSF